VVATLPTPGLEPNSISNHIFFIPPPDRVPTQPGSRDAVRYVKLQAEGTGTGEGARMMGEARPTTADQTVGKKNESTDSVVAEPIAPTKGQDSVYSVLEVDTAVVRSSKSAAPAYPLKLLEAHIQGYVNAQYIVDTTGFADTASFQVMEATHKDFIAAVKDVLPYMRFQPAKIGKMKVKQLVQQQFSFKITDTGTVVPKKKP
jgi:outer membrane biosynthesis protein TonB